MLFGRIRSKPISPFIVIWIVCVGLLAYALVAADHQLTYLLIVFFLILASTPIIIDKFSSEDLDIAQPIYYVSFLYVLYFGMRALYVSFYPGELYIEYWGNPPPISWQIINYTLICVIGGFVSMLLGYYSFIPLVLHRSLFHPHLLKGKFKEKNMITKILIVYAIGLISRLSLILRGQYTYLLNPFQSLTCLHVLQLLENFCLYGYALLTVHLLSASYNKRRKIVIWSSIFCIEIIFGFLSGWKGFIIPLIGIPLLLFHYLRKCLTIQQIIRWAVVITILLVLIVFPLVKSYRQAFYEEAFYEKAGFSAYNILHAWNRAFSSLWENYSGIVAKSTRSLMNRFVGLDSFSIIIYKDNSPKGETLPLLFAAFIPRFLWKEKPTLYIGREFAIEYWNYPAEIPKSIAVTTIGELYWNYGVVGILIGMFMLGIIYRFVYLCLIGNPRTVSPLGAFLYASIFFKLTHIERSLIEIFPDVTEELVFLTIIVWFMKKNIKIKIFREKVDRAKIEGNVV